ncbi:ABC transporter A family member 1 isoform X3 [Pyrus x bretschneideri]|uniref:ABC transporter A family member 1 isoform X3 n=1 Tax=Pyrus x bretschneideri TaxID=225117 RepID=UPI00202DFB7F|nr:ABC transporter A family member 1 isoform X3 [Pyrus x bretschneideri]XP_048432418.1 ABC transporter A family member 1 isoform X3 [Pyrus x bretschneideri]XP_048432419.1 ABC transporter A family member 1 isoform X3 [Pyrus x bretschneideri]
MAFALGSINFADYDCVHVGLCWSDLWQEHEVKAKHHQLISGVYLFYEKTVCRSGAVHWKRIVDSTIVMFLTYGLAIASPHIALFSDHSMAQNVLLLVHFLRDSILLVISFIMGLIKTTASANSFLKNFFRLSPGFCFADGLASLALLRQDMRDHSSNQAFDWNVTGGSICYLGIESVCYFLLTLGLELLLSNKWTLATLKECWNSIRSIEHGTPSYLESLLKISSDVVTLDLDEDIDDKDRKN